ncbi:MAG: WSC domain-containing protein, partial [Pyrinomonadaceae bacterium]
FTGDPKTGLAAAQGAAPTAASAQGCFGNDRGAAGIRRDDHYNWAQKNPAQSVGNLKNKIDLLWRCPSMSDEQLTSAFADISVVIPRYVTKKACFGSDPHVTVLEWQPHKDWAKQRTRQQILDNLQWKIGAALKCLDQIGQINFFADNSVAIAKAPLGLGGGAIAQAPAPVAAQPTPSGQPVSGSAKGCIGFSGKWNTDHGELFLNQTANRVTDTYSWTQSGPGQISGQVTDRVFDGEFVSNRRGKLRLTLSPDGDSISAQWTEGDGSGGGSWSGKCAGPPQTTMADTGTTQAPASGQTAQPVPAQPTQPPPQAGPTIDAGGETMDGTRTASCACLFAGTWDSTATAPITMKRKSSSVEGTYLDGSMSGTLDGRKLKGQWKDTGGEGPFELEISDASCREFKGTFRQDKGQKQVPWLGFMTQAAACADAPPAGAVAQTPQPAQPAAPSSQPPAGGQSCFGNDRGAASVRCEDHSAWAQKNPKQIASNLKTKVDQLMRCPAMSKEQLDSAFADISVVIPRYVTKKACFGTDPHVTVPEWQPHKDWARQRTRDQVLNNLQWKLAAALKCLDAAGQSKFFGDSSCAIAKAPLGFGGPTAQTPTAAAQPPTSQPVPVAPQQPVSSSAKGCVGFSGKWSTTHGDVFLNQTGDRITGTNPSNGGSISGRVTGPMLDGDWVQPNNRSGKVRFTLAADGNTFKGTWTGVNRPGGPWDGTCTGPPTTELRAAVPSDTKPQTPAPPPQAKPAQPTPPQTTPAQPVQPPVATKPAEPPQPAQPSTAHTLPQPAPQPAPVQTKPAQPPVAVTGGGQYVGCFKDQGAAGGTEGRDLNGSISNSAAMTTALCVNECRTKNFAYAATQYASYCFCGNSYGKSGTSENCNMKCAGNAGDTCGGAWANSVYATGVAASASAAAKKPESKKTNGIQVVAGTYGANCPREKFGDKIARGNVTAHLASACNGKDSCDYRIDYTVIGDPAVFCKKNYVAEWRCGDGSPVRNAEAAPEAGHGSVVKLQCGNITGAVAPTIRPPAAKSTQPQPPTQAGAKGCTLAGSWAQKAEGIGSSVWTITNTGEARELGLGNAKGTAALAGNSLRIDWT